MSFGASMAGFASGLSGGLTNGQRLYEMIQEDKLAKVREQGIAEAKSMQDAASPKVQDLGDVNNLTSNPQMSRDPNADTSVNTDLNTFINKQQAQQPQQDDGGPQSSPVAAPDQPQDTTQLSSTPLASTPSVVPAAPDATGLPAAADPASTPADKPAAFANGLPDVPRKRFNVDGQGFDTAEEAAAYVKKSAPPLASYFKDALVPRMTEALIAQGKPDQAVAWQKYADDAGTHEHMKTWAKAVQLEQFGDHVGAAEQLMKLHPHFEDGIDLVKAVPTKGPDGSDGFTMTIRDKDGNEQQMYQDAKSITRMGLSQLSPIEMFNQQYKTQTQAEVMQAGAQITANRDERVADRQMANITQRDKDAAARDAAKQKAVAEENAKKAANKKDADAASNAAKMDRVKAAAELRAKDYADRIKAGSQYRKGSSPEDTRRMVWIKLKDDRAFNKLSPAEQDATVEQTVQKLHNGFTSGGASPATPGNTVPNPFVDPKTQGLPTSSPAATAPAAPAVPAVPDVSAPPAGKKAVPVFNPTTNKIEMVFR